MKTSFVLFLWVFITLPLFVLGQNLTKHNDFYAQMRLNNPKNQTIDLPFPITSLAVQLPENVDFTDFVVKTDVESFVLRRDPDAVSVDGKRFSALMVFQTPIQQFSITTGQWNGATIDLELLYAPTIPEVRLPQAFRSEDGICDRPISVSGNIWRVGLPKPSPNPSATKMNHAIVHHTSGSNTDTNYTQVVRNIFIFHTQSNGWADVGYNFLIAQDGTIFDGRDGQGVTEVDNVMGAHFCAKNNNVMGISVLGNYMLVEPPTAALNAVLSLVAWKFKKENITDANGKLAHPTATSALLNVISGHRDGCATDCPGDNIYKRLAQFRTQTQATLTANPLSCGALGWEEEQWAKNTIVFPQPAQKLLRLQTNQPIETLLLTDLLGRKIANWHYAIKTENIEINIENIDKGFYWLIIQNKKTSIAKKIMIE